MFYRYTFLFFNLIFSCSVFANIERSNMDSDPSIEMLAGLPKAPFIIEKNGAGLQLDLVRAAFASVERQVSFTHVPLGRNITRFKRLNSDGVATIPSQYSHPGFYVSVPYVKYQNVAVSLSDLRLNISSVSDLQGKSIIAFQNAKKFLGEDYNNNIKLATNYREFAEQNKQIEMLFSRRTEIIILDISILKYFLKNHHGSQFNQAFTIHYIFDAREYAAGFSSEQNRDLFNQGIAQIKSQGIYQLILDKYLL